MGCLCELPPELLNQVAQYKGVLVLNLWKCGNRQLIARLANGIARVVLIDKRFNTTSRFPMMLLQLKVLQRLEISMRSDYRFMDACRLNTLVKQLSPTLQHIYFNFYEAEQAFVEEFYISHSVEDEGDMVVQGGQLFDFARHFPRLATLWLYGKRVLQPHHLAALPDTLINLGIPKCRAEELTRLPPRLESLLFYGLPDSPSAFILTLPQTLTRITSFSKSTTMLYPQGLAQHLPNLQHYTANDDSRNQDDYNSDLLWNTCDSFENVYFDFETERERSIPQMFRSATLFGSIDESQIFLLPRHLTSLHIHEPLEDYEFGKDVVSSLPRSLTDLEAQIDWRDPLQLVKEDFPPRLSSLCSRYTDMISSDWELLPVESMRRIWCKMDCVYKSPTVDDLVAIAKLKNLTELKLGAYQETTIPVEFQRLAMLRILDFGKSIFESHSYCNLPANLVELKLFLASTWKSVRVPILPSAITSLHLRIMSNKWIDLSSFDRLPTNLTELQIDGIITNIHSVDCDVFPKNLLSVAFYNVVNEKLLCNLLAALPSTVRTVTVYNSPTLDQIELDANVLTRLPSHCETFFAPIRPDSAKDIHMKSLPKSLTNLIVQQECVFTPEVIPFLPRHLNQSCDYYQGNWRIVDEGPATRRRGCRNKNKCIYKQLALQRNNLP